MRAYVIGLVGLLLLGRVDGVAASDLGTHKYWVFFSDKDQAAKSSAVADISFRAKTRRELRARQTGTWEDLHVSRPYVDAVEALGATVHFESRWFNAVSVDASRELARRLAELPFVTDVRPVGRVPASVPDLDDAGIRVGHKSANLDFGLSSEQLAFVNAIRPLEESINGTGVRIGFLDTQFDFTHPALRHVFDEGRLIEVRDFTGPIQDRFGETQSNFHGLNVASIAVGFHSGNLIGPGHGAEVLAATTEFAPREVNMEEDSFVAGLEWMESEGVDVVNVSLGYTEFDAGEFSYTPDDLDGQTGITTLAAERAAALGVVMVVSAGNSGNDAWRSVSMPADGPSVIAVGAARPDSTRAAFSSLGPTADGRIKPNVTAMGTNVLVAVPGGGYARGAGTSFSSPMVAGIVCQMLQVNPTLGPAEVLDILEQTSSRSSNPDNAFGWGIVNGRAAVDAARGSSGVEIPEAFALTSAYPNPFRGSLTIEVSAPGDTRPVTLKLYDALGREVDLIYQGHLIPGINRITYQSESLTSGVYFYVLQTDGGSATGPLVHLR